MSEASRLPRERLLVEVPALVRDVIEAASLLGTDLWKQVDITVPQREILVALQASGPLRPGFIAKAIGVSSASVTGILDRLEERGYVERVADPSDRRATSVRLTETGAAILDGIYAEMTKRLSVSLERMSDDDLEAYHRGLVALLQAKRDQLAEESAAAEASA